MKISNLAAFCLGLVSLLALAQEPPQPTFEVVSVKRATPSASRIACSGGPGTSDPGWFRCSNVPLGLLIVQAYDFRAYQFRPNDPCCLDGFDIAARIPPGTNVEQFHGMLRTLLQSRFELKFHYEKKEMPVYTLTVAAAGLKMNASRAGAEAADDPWAPPKFTVGSDGYPVYPRGRGGVAGVDGHYRWVGFAIPMEEIIKTLSFYSGRPVIDATGLTGKYDIDLKWWIDLAWALENAGHSELLKDLPESAPGPPLVRAVREQLGLQLTPGKGQAEIVKIDHLARDPVEN